jgi:hypothetical protein
MKHSLGLLLALVVLASCKPDKGPDSSVTSGSFVLLSAEETGIDFVNRVEQTEETNIITYEYFYNGGGVAVGDINNDGLPDLFFTSNQLSNRLYLNKGDLRFEDITEKAGVAGQSDWSNGVTMADVNADGYLDIYVSNSGRKSPPEKRRNELFINNKDLTFSEQAQDFGIADSSFSTQSIFFDIDNDNDLDLFIMNRPERTYNAE